LFDRMTHRMFLNSLYGKLGRSAHASQGPDQHLSSPTDHLRHIPLLSNRPSPRRPLR
jgi:hypothetical protein